MCVGGMKVERETRIRQRKVKDDREGKEKKKRRRVYTCT